MKKPLNVWGLSALLLPALLLALPAFADDAAAPAAAAAAAAAAAHPNSIPAIPPGC